MEDSNISFIRAFIKSTLEENTLNEMSMDFGDGKIIESEDPPYRIMFYNNSIEILLQQEDYNITISKSKRSNKKASKAEILWEGDPEDFSLEFKGDLEHGQYDLMMAFKNFLKKNHITNQIEIAESKTLSVPQQHQKKIAIRTLKMNDVGADVMGGMTKSEARNFLKGIGYSDSQIKNLEQ